MLNDWLNFFNASCDVYCYTTLTRPLLYIFNGFLFVICEKKLSRNAKNIKKR